MHRLTSRLHRLLLWAYEIMPIVIILWLTTSVTYGLELNQRSIYIQNNAPSATTQYTVSFGLSANETLGSIEIEFCSNSPLLFMSCTAPTNFNDLNANLVNESGISGLTINNGLSNQNTLILSRVASLASANQLTFVFSNITNPSASGSFYARFQTFASSNASGSPTDVGGDAMDIESPYTISATVPPYLLLCVGVSIPGLNCNQSQGSLINFGSLSPSYTASAQSQMVIATNAQNGYAIQLSGNTMTSGNHIIPPLNSDNPSSPGTSQFGINLVANSQPAIGSNPIGPGSGSVASSYSKANDFKFSNGDIIAQSNQASSYKEYTISYILNMAKNQSPGVYSTTISFIGMAYF